VIAELNVEMRHGLTITMRAAALIPSIIQELESLS